MSETIHDTTSDFSCPYCRGENLRYRSIDSSQLHYKQDGENHIDFFGQVRDYSCADCSAEWVINMGSIEP